MKDIDQIRRENMVLLEEEAGGPTAAASRLGWDQPQWSNLRSGAADSKTGRPRGMRKDTARKIEAAFGRGLLWLDTDHGSATNVAPALERNGRVPMISWVAAGDFAHAADLLQPGEAYEWIDTSVAVRPHTFALRVEGDSMEPEFMAGTILVVEPEIEAHPGDYVIARNGHQEATFKQLVRDGADLYLKPMNPRYPLKPLGDSVIVGVVREAVKRYR